MSTHLLYGDIPPGLVPVPPGSVQTSPLMPGSAALEAFAAASCEGLVMRAPANTVERRHEMALALRALNEGAAFVILAPKDKGGARLAKELSAFGCDVTDQPRQHHRICMGMRPKVLAGLDACLEEGALRLQPGLGLVSQPGLFSWDRIDPGAAALLDVLPPLSGRIGDFGCGYGLLSLGALKSKAVIDIAGLDVDRRAVAAARRNITDPRFRAIWIDIAATGAGITNLDAIIMNPPFHRAGIEDQGLGATMISRAAQALRPGGVLWLTANRHLPYEAPLRAAFRNLRLASEDSGFKVYEATR